MMPLHTERRGNIFIENNQLGYGLPLQRTDTPLISNLGCDPAPTAITHNQLMAFPFVVPKKLNMVRIGIQVTTAQAGANARVGIYNDDGNRYPDELIVDGGAVSCATTGNKLATIDEDLEPGIYWGASLLSAANVQTWVSNGGMQLIDEADRAMGWRVAQAYGALPDPFTAGGAASLVVCLPKYQIDAYL